MLKLDPQWLKDGTGSGSFVPTMKTERGAVVLTSLAPQLSLSTIASKLEREAAFAGLAEESATEGQLVRVVIRVKRGNDPVEFARVVRKVCRTTEHYSFLQINQFTAEGEVDYLPVIEGPASFLKSWVEWRTTVVVGAARHRIGRFEAEIARHSLFLRAIAKRAQLLKLLERRMSSDQMRSRVMAIVRCTEEEAREVMAISWPRLANMEGDDLKTKIAEREKAIIAEQKIVARPQGRLVIDLQSAVKSVEATLAEVAAGKNGRRARS